MEKKWIFLTAALFCGMTGLASADQGPFVSASLKLAPGVRITFQNRPVAQSVYCAPVQRVVVREPRYFKRVERYPQRVIIVRDRGRYGYGHYGRRDNCQVAYRW